jgi:ubiquinone/menaquinone biosynthesis C-methylase UbiE
MKSRTSFNFIARPYRWLEYLTLGHRLERCRLHFLPYLLDQKKVLVLGDGDGRFLAELMAAAPDLRADAVDSSSAMLHQLRRRCMARTLNAAARLETHHIDALAFKPIGPYDLVATHFFLDCLDTPSLDALISRVRTSLAPGALWVVSDFRIPSGPMRLPALILVRSLYLAFRILTGLRTNRLPDHAKALSRAGLVRTAHHDSFSGMLTTELWQLK